VSSVVEWNLSDNGFYIYNNVESRKYEKTNARSYYRKIKWYFFHKKRRYHWKSGFITRRQVIQMLKVQYIYIFVKKNTNNNNKKTKTKREKLIYTFFTGVCKWYRPIIRQAHICTSETWYRMWYFSQHVQ